MSQSSDGTSNGYPGSVELADGVRYELLSNARRRVAMAALAVTVAPIDLDELAADVAAREARPDLPGGTAIDDALVSLHHVHLPKLDDAGLVDYDREANRVESVAVTADLLGP